MTDNTYEHGYKPDTKTGPDWRWMLILGVLLIVGGAVAFLNPFAASLTAVAIAGTIFTLGGILQLWIAFKADAQTSAKLTGGLLGLLILAFGVSLLANPLAGILSLTLLVAAFFFAAGIVRVWLGYQLKSHRGWGWLVASGVVSVALAVLIVGAIPEAAAGLLGLFLGIDLLSSGIGLSALALQMRNR